MAKVSPIQSNFNGGEWSPLAQGRVEAERYKTALKVCKNYLPTIQGGLTRRPATKFVAATKTASKASRLIPFEYSTTQAYMIEFGDSYVRFYKNNALITLAAVNITAITKANPAVVTSNAHGFSNGDRVVLASIGGMVELNNREVIVANVTANTFEIQTTLAVNINSTNYTTYTSGGTASEVYEIVSPYPEAKLFEIKYTQSADVLYLTHPLYAPRKLIRTTHTSWAFSTITFLDGPYLTVNSTTTTMTPSAATGAGVTLTASAVAGINNDTGFASTDVGRYIRLKEGSVWGYVLITGWTSTTIVTVTVVKTLTNTNAKTNFRMGVWSETTGYPAAVCFHEDRLCFTGNTNTPQRIDGSKSGDYENMAPSDTDGTVSNDNAVSFSLNANDVNVTRWLTSDEKGLLAGSVGGEWVVKPSSQSEALSPTNISAKRTTSYGSANVQPVQAGKASIFVQRSGRKLKEMAYFYEVDGFKATNLTQLAEHITTTGIIQLAFQKEPQGFVWGVRDDGVLVAMTYDRDADSLKAGFSRHHLGGTSDAAGSEAQVESVACIPSADGTRDEVWVIVKRYINGASHRYVEYLTKIFEDEDEQRDAFFVDCGLSYDQPLTITAATAANPVVVTSNSHGLSNGDIVLITDVEGMTELNGEAFTVANVAANTFELSGINGTSYGTYISGGEARKRVSTVSGLFHLEGESVDILADGAVRPAATVTNGIVTLSSTASTVSVGYGYESDAQLLRIEAGAADGTALGKTRRTHRVGFLLHRSLGLKIGMDFDSLDTITFRTSSDPLTRAPGLFSGVLSENIQADYDYENQICWRQDQPLPSTILAVMPQMVTQDRG